MRLILSILLISLVCISLKSQNLIESKVDSLISHSNYEEAIQLIKSQNNQGYDLRNKEAEALMALGKLSDAESILNKIFSDDQFTNAITQNNLGYLDLLKGRSDLAQDHLEKARDWFKGIGMENSKEAAKCFSNLSLLYWSTGKFSQAEENGLIALQLRQAIFGNESEETAASLNDLGLVYGSTDADKGLEYYEKALSIYGTLYGKDNPKIAIASTNIGLMYFNLELYGDAINNFESARTIWKKTYPQGHPNEALSLVNLGRTYAKLKNDKAALKYYEDALSIYTKNYGAKHPDIATVYNQTGNIKLTNSEYLSALSDFQQALCANSPNFNSLNHYQNPNIQNFYNGKVMLFSMRLKEQALETLYYGKTLKLSDLKLALSTLESCDTLIDVIRHNSANESDKIGFGGLANEVYADGVRIAHAISELTPKGKYYRERSFYFAEKSKSAVLQESIADSQAKSFAGIPIEILEEEKNKKSTITFLSQKLSEKPTPEEEKNIRSSLFNANLEYQKLIKKMENDFPSYYNLKFSSSTASVPELQKTISSDQAIVSFFIDEKNKRIYQFIITKKKLKIASNSIPDNFYRSIKGFINSLLYSDFPTYKQSQAVLKIIKPKIPQYVKSVIIIPYGKLSSIPFEALVVRKTNASNFKETEFFIKRANVSYEFAAGLLLQKNKAKKNNTDEIFLCAPIKFHRDNLNDLPGTEKEIAVIASLFPRQSRIFTFDDANESAIKSKEIQNTKYIHLATHGIVTEISK